MERIKSKEAFLEAEKYIPGGVNSPVRALQSVKESPLFIRQASGAELTDIDGNKFIDFCLSWGVFIAGHAHPEVNEAIIEAVQRGSSYGIPTEAETLLARLVNQSFPSMEKVRFVNSGTEAVMSAVRVARGYTGRNILVKFDGCYHGHADHLLVNAGSGVALIQNASSAGVPAEFVKYTVTLPYNNLPALEEFFLQHGKEVAAVIIKPVACNMGVVLPGNGFLEGIREITKRYGVLLIFDEVITGFRLAKGGTQEYFNIVPDLTTIGKIAGGGFPAAAFGGKAEIMNRLAPAGDIYQAGTLSGNPVAMAAGIATHHILSREGFYDELEEKSNWFISGLRTILSGKDIELNSISSMYTIFFTSGKVQNFTDAKQSNLNRFGSYFRYMLKNGIYLSPSQFEGNFLSIAHTQEQLEKTLDKTEQFF
ncbi:MAG: glutamate-1-semialdehyde 2,1-aminomutase [Tannerellaceae bacterium]|nr:glutamate-1-semialdehyde 2,1-aminomutase [Tannerellaceae bacterium]